MRTLTKNERDLLECILERELLSLDDDIARFKLTKQRADSWYREKVRERKAVADLFFKMLGEGSCEK